MIDEKDRIVLIGYTFGCIVSKFPTVDNELAVQEINNKLVAINQPVMTKEEEDYLDQIDRMMDLYRLATTNRKNFRDFSVRVIKANKR